MKREPLPEIHLSPAQRSRYARHLLLPEIGRSGQERLLGSSVAVIGLGGLGCPAALYLAAAGVGRLGLFDPDKAELSNLQRQILHSSKDLKRPKVESAAEKLEALNPDPKLELRELRLDAHNALEFLEPYDLVLEGTDNLPSKFLVNDACLSLGKPLVQAGIFRFEGQLMAIAPGQSPCYRCLFESAPAEGEVASCAEGGILGAVAGVMGTLMAGEALKILAKIGEPLYGKLLCFDALKASFRQVPLHRRPGCPACAGAGKRFALRDEAAPCAQA
jgi:adenylyltransferase/sulfurtransferase